MSNAGHKQGNKQQVQIDPPLVFHPEQQPLRKHLFCPHQISRDFTCVEELDTP